jgi:type II secretory pathway component PulF
VFIALGVLLIVAVAAIFVRLLLDEPAAAMALAGGLCAAGGIALSAYRFWHVAGRRRRSAILLNHIEQAMRLNLPLPRIFHAIAEAETDRRAARQFEAARQDLEQGCSLAEVLARTAQLPPRVVGLLAAAERVGRMPQVLGRLAAQRQAAIARSLWPGRTRFYHTYPLVVGLALVFIMNLLMVFVIPKFQQLFRGFGLPLPRITRMTIELAWRAGPIVMLLLVALLLTALLAGLATRWFDARFGLVEDMWNWIANRLPGIGTYRLYRALGEVLDFTAEAIDAGRPVTGALQEAASLAANSRLRRRVRRWVDQLQHGATLAEGARAAGMPRLVSAMLSTPAAEGPETAEVFRFLGRYYAMRFSRAVAVLESATVPALALVMGLFVGWIALSMFLPLIHLIDHVGPYPSGV